MANDKFRNSLMGCESLVARRAAVVSITRPLDRLDSVPLIRNTSRSRLNRKRLVIVSWLAVESAVALPDTSDTGPVRKIGSYSVVARYVTF